MRRVILLSALLVLSVVGGLLAPSSSAAPATPFDVTGVVVDEAAPIPPTTIEGENAAFRMDDFSRVSLAAQRHVAEDGLIIHGTPSTNYFNQNADGLYLRSTYEQTVVEGAELRVAGRFVEAPEGVRFIAQYVWRPPYEGTDSTGAVPSCAMQAGQSSKPFLIVATIKEHRTHLPCTGVGAVPGGFGVNDFQVVSRAVAPAVVAYGGLVDIYISPTTTYIKDGKRSDYTSVVLPRTPVKIWGNFVHARGAWLLVAKVIMTPPGEQSPEETVTADITALEGETGWSGNSRGPAFTGGGYSADLTWTPDALGWKVSGTWRLANSAGDVLTGLVDGTVTNGRLAADVVVTGGSGYYAGANGIGTFNGTATGIGAPSALDARLNLRVTRPEPEPAPATAEEPTDQPTDTPTEEPTDQPTDTPTEEPTEEPTDTPTEEPTEEPTDTPTEEPTDEPTTEPSS